MIIESQNKPELKESFTSTGSKIFWHQEALSNMRNKKGQPIVAHILPTDVCQDTCGMCSVMTRDGKSLSFSDVRGILDQLCPLKLQAVIISGGGNPILWRCRESRADFNDLISEIVSRGLQVGLITNGLKMKEYPCGRTSWVTVRPETLDKLTWVRISMSGLDHERRSVEVPDIDTSKTTLGFSYIYHDIFYAPNEPNHGKVSTLRDFRKHQGDDATPVVEYADDRLPWLEEQIRFYVEKYNPKYCRLLCDCLRPDLIDQRHATLSAMAGRINPEICFSQWKPPSQPRACYKGYPHPVINSDGGVFFCDSVVLNTAANADANHKFSNQWRVCHWTELSDLYSRPMVPGVPNTICPGCVFYQQVEMLADIVDGVMDVPPPPIHEPEHSAFI